ncbi:MAG: hypothetical protein QM727_03365 [Niabella sp.]
MKKISLTLITVLLSLILIQCSTHEQKEENTGIEDFYNQYENYLDKGLYDSVALLYDREGAIILDMDTPEKYTYASIQQFYKGRAYMGKFHWDDLMFEDLDNNNAFVTGGFTFINEAKKDTSSYLYTAVLTKKNKKWYIQQEIEFPKINTAIKMIEKINAQKKPLLSRTLP